MTQRDLIGDLDLFAYADGRLDSDPGRKAAVEAYVRDAPEAASRLRAYMAQTRALRRAYGGRASEPVPQNLIDAVYWRPLQLRRGRPGMRAAAMALAAIGTGLAGWFLGQWHSGTARLSQDAPPETLLEMASAASTGELAPTPPSRVIAGGMRTIQWRAEGSVLRMRVPDLSPLGYTLIARDRSGASGAVRLKYLDARGGAIWLFMLPGAQSGDGDVSIATVGGKRLAHWSQGFVDIVMAGPGLKKRLPTLAGDVRRIMARPPAPGTRDDDHSRQPPAKLDVTADARRPDLPERIESARDVAPALHVDGRID